MVCVCVSTAINVISNYPGAARAGLSNRFCLSVCLSICLSVSRPKNIVIRPTCTVYGFKEYLNKRKMYLLPFLGAGFVHMTLSQ